MNPVSNLAKTLTEGKLVLTTRLSFPPDVNVEDIRKKARLFKDYTAVIAGEENSTDLNISSLALAIIFKEEGIEPILQINSRDKNRIAIQKEILTAICLGVNNIFTLSGIHPYTDKNLGTKTVYDLEPINMVAVMKKIRDERKLPDGKDENLNADIFIGIEDNPLAEPINAMPLFLDKKIRAGADFILTYPIFDIQKFKNYVDKIKILCSLDEINLIATIYIANSIEDIDNLKKSYPGVSIPQSILDNIENIDISENSGIEIAFGISESLKKFNCVKGFNLLSNNNFDSMIELSKKILDSNKYS